MNPTNTILLLCLFFNHSVAGQKKSAEYKWPGFIQLNDSVFISEREISISEYGEALGLMKLLFGSYERLEEAMPSPNSLHWKGYDPFRKISFSVDQIFEIHGVTKSEYKKKKKPDWFDTTVSYLAFISRRPIVNITKPQALLYCDLRTKAFTLLKQNTRKKKGWHLPDSVCFRLPLHAEWKLAFNDSMNIYNSRNGQTVLKNNVIISKQYIESLKTGESLPESVYYGYANKLGILNLCGNVGELLMDSPYTFGGSFSDTIENCSPFLKNELLPPQENIGFRIVAVIKR